MNLAMQIVFAFSAVMLGLLGIDHILKDDGLGGLFAAVSALMMERAVRTARKT